MGVEPKQAVLLGAAGALAIVSARFLLKKLLEGTDKYEGLEGAVSYSSRKIAAARAMEAEEESPLVNDPLAASLAGPKAIAAARRRQQPAPANSGRKIKVNMMAIRTKWFDDQLEASLGMPVAYSAEQNNETPYLAATALPGNPPRQVVLLGSGMDSRAWRLKLPAGLKWFEVDRQDVLEAKEMLLAAAGAEVEPVSPMTRAASTNALLEQKIGSIDHHVGGIVYPLRAHSWSAVIADLGDPSWVKALINSGFNPTQPTVWIAEGLLMYLEPDRCSALLQEVAQLSSPGSALLTVSVTEDVIRDIEKKGSSSELMNSWKFGCPADPREWLKGLGWNVDVVGTRATIARALKLSSEVCSFETDTGSEKDGRSLFIAASV